MPIRTLIRRDTPRRQVDVPPIGIYESLRQFRIKEDQKTQIEQVSPKQKCAATAYGDVAGDLDRIAQAISLAEVLDIVNQVLQLLHRSRRIEEIPEAMCPQAFQSASQLHEALGSNIGWTQSSNDAVAILQTLVDDAQEDLRPLEGR